jgi:alkaline phosphatase
MPDQASRGRRSPIEQNAAVDSDGSQPSTSTTNSVAGRSVVCVVGDGIGVLRGKTYRVVPDAEEEARGDPRVIDESNEAFCYTADSFEPVP